MSYWPRTLASGRLGIAMLVYAGTGVEAEAASYRGELTQWSVDLNARVRLRATPWLAFELGGGPALVVTSFDMSVLERPTTLHAVRLDPAADVMGIVDLLLAPGLALGAVAQTALLMRFQHYTLNGVQVLNEPPVQGFFGLRVSLGVD
jgi:hypothetical protein